MKFNEFVNHVKNIGGVDTDGYFGKQCMDLYNYYCKQVLELNGDTGSNCAKNILNNSYVMSNMERINNYSEFIPQKGDIAVWTNGTYGHVAICLGEGDVNKFKTIDQNWKAQQLTEEWHDYLYLAPIVFLRPKNQKNIIESQAYNVRITADVLNVRCEPNINTPRKAFTELSKNAQEQIMSIVGYPANGYVKGMECTILEVQGEWGRTPSGWISLDYTIKI